MVISNPSNSNGSSMNYPISSGSYHSLNGGIVNASNISSNLSNLPHGSSAIQSLCCLVDNGVKCTRTSGNASYSKRIEKQVVQRKLRLSVDQRSSHTYICEHHKQIIQSHRTGGKRKRKDEDYSIDDELGNDFHANDSSNDMSHTMALNAGSSYKSYSSSSSPYDIDLHSLQVNTLRRYKRHFRISTKPGLNKTQLAEELSRHFRTITVYPEKDVVNHFMYTIKSNTNKLDFNQNKEN